MIDQHIIIGKKLLEAYPSGVCSQGVARDIALQLPRVINDFRYKPNWQLEAYKPLKINLISSTCHHRGTKTAADYHLSKEGYIKLASLLVSPRVAQQKQAHSFNFNEDDYILVGDTFVRRRQPRQEALL